MFFHVDLSTRNIEDAYLRQAYDAILSYLLALIHMVEHLDSPLGHERASLSQDNPDEILADGPEVQLQELLADGFGRLLQHGSVLFQLEHDSDELGQDIAPVPAATSSGPLVSALGLAQLDLLVLRTLILDSCGMIGHMPLRSQKTVGWLLRADCGAFGQHDHMLAALLACLVLDEAECLDAWRDLYRASQSFEDLPFDLRVCLDLLVARNDHLHNAFEASLPVGPGGLFFGQSHPA